MSKKGVSGDRHANHVARERTVECRRCQNPFTAMMANTPRKYCDECRPIVFKARKKIAAAKSNAKRRGKPVPGQTTTRPRLVRYAGYDPGERH